MPDFVSTQNVTDLMASAVGLLRSVWPLVLIAAGVPVGFYVAKKLIGLIPKK